MTSARMKGHTSRENSAMEILPSAQTTYMTVPTGGVMAPIMMLSTKTIPK